MLSGMLRGANVHGLDTSAPDWTPTVALGRNQRLAQRSRA